MAQATDTDTTTADNVRPFPGTAPAPPRRSNARPKDPTGARSKRYRKKRKRDAKRDAEGADQQSNRDDKDAPGQTYQTKKRKNLFTAARASRARSLRWAKCIMSLLRSTMLMSG